MKRNLMRVYHYILLYHYNFHRHYYLYYHIIISYDRQQNICQRSISEQLK